MNYKIVSYETYFNSHLINLDSVIIFTDYLADGFLRLKTETKIYFAFSIFLSLGVVPFLRSLLVGSHIYRLCKIRWEYNSGARCCSVATNS
jgi:hypothetical protein